MEITLNTNVLSGASQEYVASVIMHEILHASLTIQGSAFNSLTQHYTIAKDYTDKLIVALQHMFPTLSDKDAAALALTGYDYLRKNADYQSFFNNLLTHYNITDVSELESIVRGFRKGLVGTQC